MARTAGTGTGEAMRVAGALALVGCAAAVVANIVGSVVVDGHDWVRDTISYLAEGPHGWIQDTGLVLFAAGLVAAGVGLWLLDLGGWGWRIGVLCLVLMGADVVLIALYEAYGERTPDGVVIHSQAVWALGAFFALGLLLLAGGLGRVGPGWRRFTIGIAIAWIVLAPPFFMIPTGFDGLYERTLALIVIAWIVPVAVMLIAEGRAR